MATRWPTTDRAIQWLIDQQVATPQLVEGMVNAAQLQSDAVGATVTRSTIDALNREIQASVAAGEGRDAAVARIKKVIAFRRNIEENLVRTATHRAYNAGQRTVAEGPAGRLFQYRQYLATRDTRVRDSHEEMDGKVYHKDSPMARKARALLDEWGCRCTERLLRRAEAERLGIDDDTGWVPPAPKPVVPLPISRRIVPEVQIPPVIAAPSQVRRTVEDAKADFPDRKKVRKLVEKQLPLRDMEDAVERLDKGKKEAFREYAAGAIDYRKINAKIRDNEPLPAGLRRDFERVNQAVEAAGRLPGDGVTVYRGLHLKEAEKAAVLKSLQEGKTLQWDGLTSTSIDPDGAASYVHGGEGIVFEIKAKKGAYITRYSPFDDLARKSKRQKENEVLLPSGGRFRVVSVQDDVSLGKKARKGQGYTVVQLEEVDTTSPFAVPSPVPPATITPAAAPAPKPAAKPKPKAAPAKNATAAAKSAAKPKAKTAKPTEGRTTPDMVLQALRKEIADDNEMGASLLADLRQQMGDDTEAFDRAVWKLAQDGVIEVHRHNAVGQLSPEERAKLVKVGDHHYTGVNLTPEHTKKKTASKRVVPAPKIVQLKGADLEQKIVQSIRDRQDVLGVDNTFGAIRRDAPGSQEEFDAIVWDLYLRDVLDLVEVPAGLYPPEMEAHFVRQNGRLFMSASLM